MFRVFITYLLVLIALLANGQNQLHARAGWNCTDVVSNHHIDGNGAQNILTVPFVGDKHIEIEAVEEQEEDEKYSCRKITGNTYFSLTLYSAAAVEAQFGHNRSKTFFHNINSNYTLSKKFILFEVFRI